MAEESYTDAIALLKADHRTVEALFEQFENARSNKRAIAEEACTLLKIHMMLEEEIFYPALRGKVADDKLDEGLVEHDAGKVLINDILSAGADEAHYPTKFHVLAEEMVHHHKEEEEFVTGIFAEARKSGVDLVALRDEMLDRRAKLETKADAGKLPSAETNFVDTAAT